MTISEIILTAVCAAVSLGAIILAHVLYLFGWKRSRVGRRGQRW